MSLIEEEGAGRRGLRAKPLIQLRNKGKCIVGRGLPEATEAECLKTEKSKIGISVVERMLLNSFIENESPTMISSNEFPQL